MKSKRGQAKGENRQLKNLVNPSAIFDEIIRLLDEDNEVFIRKWRAYQNNESIDIDKQAGQDMEKRFAELELEPKQNLIKLYLRFDGFLRVLPVLLARNNQNLIEALYKKAND